MKERPILFKGEMVDAILAGAKTQTRRSMKPQPEYRENDSVQGHFGTFFQGWNLDHDSVTVAMLKCPFGQAGDQLWVKEVHFRYGCWIKNGISKTGKQEWKFVPTTAAVRYHDNPPSDIKNNNFRAGGWYKRNSLFMPRKCARTFLEITGIRVERLQDISDEDAICEGVLPNCKAAIFKDGKWSIPENANCPRQDSVGCDGCRDEWVSYPLSLTQQFPEESAWESFRSLWDSINGFQSWAKNPWLWVVEFKRIDR